MVSYASITVATLLVSVLVCAHQADALADNGYTRYSVSAGSKKCTPFGNHCCPYQSCSMIVRAHGSWYSENTAAGSTTDCSAHYSKCISLCRCAVRVRQVRSTTTCSCVRDASTTSALYESCQRQCVVARTNCINFDTDRRCPEKSRTVINFTKEVEGKCAGICRKSLFAVESKPSVRQLSPAEEEAEKACRACKDGKCTPPAEG